MGEGERLRQETEMGLGRENRRTLSRYYTLETFFWISQPFNSTFNGSNHLAPTAIYV